jgi:hypothetical protein
MGFVRRLLRSRFMPLIFLGALLIFGVKTCGSEAATVELVFDFGSAAGDVRELRVDLHKGTEVAPVAYHVATYGDGGARTGSGWKLRVDAGDYTARVTIKTTTGMVTTTRKLEVSDRAKIVIPLERELAGKF